MLTKKNIRKLSFGLILLLTATILLIRLGTPTVGLELFFYKQEIPGAMRELADAFTNRYPGIIIETVRVPDASITYLRNRIISGNAPDLIQLQAYAQVWEFAADEFLLDLSSEDFLSRVLPQYRAAGTYNGRMYALPVNHSGIGIIYNKNLFQQYGLTPPTTLDELKQTCRRLQEQGLIPFAGMLQVSWSAGQFATLLHASLSSSNSAIENWITAMNSGEASWITPVDKQLLFSLMDFYKQNLDPDSIVKRQEQQVEMFGTNQAAMMVQGLWTYGKIKEGYPDAECGFIPFPVSNNPADTKFYADADSTFAISAQSTRRKQRAAKKFLNWLSGPEAAVILREKCHLISTFQEANQSLFTGPYADFLEHKNKHGAYIWEYIRYPLTVFETTAKNGAQAYLLGANTPEDFIRELDAAWRKAVP